MIAKDWYLIICVCMTGAGLLLASVFLLMGRIDGGQWTTICGVLFGAERLAQIARMVKHDKA